jgi:hypothetical protein
LPDRENFEADISVAALRCLIDGAKRVRHTLDIFYREALVERDDTIVTLRFNVVQA